MDTKNIYQRKLAVMAELIDVGKSRSNAHFGYKFTPHDDVTGPLHKLFVTHGITQEVSVLETRITESQQLELVVEIAWTNVDEPAQRIVTRAVGHCSPQLNKKTGSLQMDDLASGKALSYAVKYAQLKNFMLTGDGGDLEDDHKPEAATKELAPVADVERVMNLLAQADTKEKFKAAGDEAALISDRITPEQTKLLGAAWAAAKARTTAPPEVIQTTVVPADAGKAVAPVEGLPIAQYLKLIADYQNVIDTEQLKAARAAVATLKDKATPAQWEDLKSRDVAAAKRVALASGAA